jgi:hypothetical protein
MNMKGGIDMTGEQGNDHKECPFCSFFEQFREAEVHILNAKREILMAIRTIVDREIEMTRQSMEKRGESQRAEKVEID